MHIQKDDATTTVFKSFPGILNVGRLEPMGDVFRVVLRDLEGGDFQEYVALVWREGGKIL